jgi:hypothetical protein
MTENIREEFEDLKYAVARLNKSFDQLKDQMITIQNSIQSNSIGITNVYDEFNKFHSGYKKANELVELVNTRLDHFEKEKQVEEFDLEINRFPMDILVKIKIITNFGSIDWAYSFPPMAEVELHKSINHVYKNMLIDLYNEHDKRGGKHMGDEGCKAWFDANGKTIIHLDPQLSPRVYGKMEEKE